MDNLTHAVLGGTLGFLAARGKNQNRAAVVGMIAANLSDLDVLIRSSTDPLLGLEYHRHFSHSIFFAPVTATLSVALVLARKWFRKDPDAQALFSKLWIAALIAALSHPLLDWQTSYGTQLLLPLSSVRAATDWIAIVDLFFTLPLLLGLIVAMRSQHARAAWVGLSLSAFYFAVCGVQHHRALGAQAEIARLRGQSIQKQRVLPMVGSFLLWRSVYEVGDRYYSDAIRIPILGSTTWKAGENAPAVTAFAAPSDWAPEAQAKAARDFERFQFFAQGYTAEIGSTEGNVITDVRYSSLPESLAPLWAIRFDPLPADRPTHLVHPSSTRAGSSPRPRTWFSWLREIWSGWLRKIWLGALGEDSGYQLLYKGDLKPEAALEPSPISSRAAPNGKTGH